jgi:starch phosphorylase
LRKLGIEPTYWHANEGHAALSMVERVREYVQQGMTVEEAKDKVARHTVFTTHTPVPAGHDIFSEEQIDKYFTNYWPELGMTRNEFYALGKHGDKPGFNFTALSMRLAGHRNGVSEKHGDVSREMWYDIFPDATPDSAPIRHITNGVHLRTWIGKHMREAYQLYQPQYWKEQQEKEHVWDTILNVPDEKFWEAHMRAKQSLITAMAERSRARYVGGDFDAWQVLSSGAFQTTRVLTLGFARRFATYKRATLLFRDPDRLQRILTNPEFPVQLVFAGKAHPADDGGKQLIREIYMNARDSRFGGRIAFVEDYEMGIARNLVSGVDVWVNNPRYPLEASGTSGMKAAANGVPNFSILDGWWIEGFNDRPRNGWGIEPATHLEGDAQDEFEANAMYDMLEHGIVPLYYKRDANGLPREWIKVMKEAIRTNAPKFSARRMLIDYVEQLYSAAARGDAE